MPTWQYSYSCHSLKGDSSSQENTQSISKANTAWLRRKGCGLLYHHSAGALWRGAQSKLAYLSLTTGHCKVFSETWAGSAYAFVLEEKLIFAEYLDYSLTSTVGSNAPSARLQVTPSCVVQSTQLRDIMPSRERPTKAPAVGPSESHEFQQIQLQGLATGSWQPPIKGLQYW